MILLHEILNPKFPRFIFLPFLELYCFTPMYVKLCQSNYGQFICLFTNYQEKKKNGIFQFHDREQIIEGKLEIRKEKGDIPIRKMKIYSN